MEKTFQIHKDGFGRGQLESLWLLIVFVLALVGLIASLVQLLKKSLVPEPPVVMATLSLLFAMLGLKYCRGDGVLYIYGPDGGLRSEYRYRRSFRLKMPFILVALSNISTYLWVYAGKDILSLPAMFGAVWFIVLLIAYFKVSPFYAEGDIFSKNGNAVREEDLEP